MSYSTAMTTLTGQVAALLSAGPPDPERQMMTPLQAARALTGRNVLAGELQALSVALTGPTTPAGSALGPQHLFSDPLLVLRGALHQPPRAVPDPGRPTYLLTPGGGRHPPVGRVGGPRRTGHDELVNASNAPSSCVRSFSSSRLQRAGAT